MVRDINKKRFITYARDTRIRGMLFLSSSSQPEI